MMKFRLSLLFFLTTLFTNLCAQTIPFTAPARGFVSTAPASNWSHALLSGNGTLAAMVMGQPHAETLIFSQADLYIPLNEPKTPINQGSRMEEIRKLLLEGKGETAARIPVDQRNKEGFDIGRDPYIPAFDMHIDQQALNLKKYQRSVNFETGEAMVTWADEKGTFERRVFVSRADSVIVISIKGNAKISTTLDFAQRPIEAEQADFVKTGVAEAKATAEPDFLTFQCKFKNHYKDGLQGYEGAGRVLLKGGKVEVVGQKLQITDADEILVLIQIKPSKNWSQSKLAAMKAQLNDLSTDYSVLRDRHVSIHNKLFSRSRLHLNADPASGQLNSEALLAQSKTSVPAALIEKVYDAGRYNIISAMGKNPPNLQGIWSGTWTAPWSADFTHDGNLPAAIASVLSSNMPELMDAYFRYLEDKMPTFRENARLLYGAEGIHIPAHTSNNGLDTDFGEIWCLTYWTGAAGWAADFFYDYYQYTQNREFLKSRAYPFMKEAAAFYESFLTTGPDGKYIFNPSYSPENNPANAKSQAVINATMDVMIARQLLNNCIAAAKTLALDAPKVKLWTEMLSKMPEYEVASDGTLREWLWPGLEENMPHRHVSQLYALYNKADSAITGNPALLAAVNKTIDGKMKFREDEGGGEMSFGLVQLGLAAAHIGEAEKAKTAVDFLSSKYWSTGMGSFHNVGELFNTDISGGLPAVILEMLVYSEQDMIKLLPALPKAWNKGKLEGALLRGNIQLQQLEWADKRIKVTLRSGVRRQVNLVMPAEVEQLKINGFTVSNNRIKDRKFLLNLPQTREVNLEITLK
ncbi:glycosyl hydrolase family 95 catalytic domain-containing protein [Pedobacter sp. SAFR-022]|uniref:glycosyl hydrolase family 95 catalytic domain-containing protein n=1 Tax=Pedobacter sp. SAFR-022 TaxID=3436861 RepID=UPI003F7F5D02